MFIIGTHKRPHPDELGGAKLLISYGEQFYPGISKAKIIEYVPGVTKTKCDLLIGIGGGEFDDHSDQYTDDYGRKKTSTIMIIAKKLNIHKKPEIEQLLTYIHNNDINGSGSAFELSSIISITCKQYGVEVAYDFMSKFMDAKIAEQKEFLKAVEEFKKIRIINFNTGYIDIRIAGIATENEQILKAARSCFKGGNHQADILIIFRKNGHVQIFKIAYDCDINFSEIVKRLRVSEFSKRNIDYNSLKNKIGNFNVISDYDAWCYPFETAILNGSFSRPDAVATILSRKEIYAAILEGIKSSY